MKLINHCFVLLILCGVFEKSHGTDLDCQFGNKPFGLGNQYSCEVLSLDNSNNTMVITGYSGRNDSDVKGIWIQDTNTRFIPKNLGLLFDLTALSIVDTQLIEIKSQDFNGMQDLKELYLQSNKLTFVPIDAFFTLEKLKQIFLSFNQIEEIPNGVFRNNLQLETIILEKNQIKFLGSFAFDGLTKLNYVDLEENICINDYYTDNTAIIQLKNDIKSQCKNPNENPITSTQNPLELENDLMKELNINLEKENIELKSKLEKHESDRVVCATKIKELEDRLTIDDAQESTDFEMNPIEKLFVDIDDKISIATNDIITEFVDATEKHQQKLVELLTEAIKSEFTESSFVYTCQSNEWRCNNDECILLDFLCDAQTDCLDKSDESSKTCDPPLPESTDSTDTEQIRNNVVV